MSDCVIFKRIATLCLVFLLWAGVAGAPPRVRELAIPIIAGERWWGLGVGVQGLSQPFERDFVVHTSELPPGSFRANVLLSSRGRYLHSESDMRVSYDGERLVVTPSLGESVALHKGGRTLKDALLACRHKSPPSPQLYEAPIYEIGGEGALLCTQGDVLQFADYLSDMGVPKGMILIPLGWYLPSGQMCFNKVAYPNPREMIEELRREGFGVMLTVSPYVMAAGIDYRRALQQGSLLVNAKGEPIVFQSHYGYTACSTLSEERVEEMNTSLRRLQSDYGVDGFYFDLLDVEPHIMDSTTEPKSLIGAWRRAAEGLQGVIYSSPVESGVVCSVATSRLYDWEELRRSVSNSIGASLLGYEPIALGAGLKFGGDERLTLRTALFAALMPVAIIPYQVWSQRNIHPLLEVLFWREENWDSVTSYRDSPKGSCEPLIRPLEYQFPRMGFVNCANEYMLGDEWLVVPAAERGDRCNVRFPRGRWREWGSGRIVRGPRVVDLDVSDSGVALFQLVE